MPTRLHYACLIRIRGFENFFLWYTNTNDGVVLNERRILTFPTRIDLEIYCKKFKMPLSEDLTVVYDFDLVDQWIANPTVESLDNELLLNMWNMIDDLYTSIGLEPAISPDDLDLHEKLSFSSFASNIPGAVVNEDYDPQWTESDCGRLAKALRAATNKFTRTLQ